MADLFHYQIFGLNIASELLLSVMFESDFSHPDLIIRKGSVPTTLDDYVDRGVFYFAAPGKFLFEMDGIGRFLVNDGKEIIVQKQENAEDSEVNLFLLGSVMGATLLQRGLIPLHGSTITKNNNTLVVCGKSGAGKSSLAAEYIRKGYALVADDISVVDFLEEKIHVRKGIQQLKLWADTLDSLQLKSSHLLRVRSSIDKYYLPFNGSTLSLKSELNFIVILEVKKFTRIYIQRIERHRKISIH